MKACALRGLLLFSYLISLNVFSSEPRDVLKKTMPDGSTVRVAHCIEFEKHEVNPEFEAKIKAWGFHLGQTEGDAEIYRFYFTPAGKKKEEEVRKIFVNWIGAPFFEDGTHMTHLKEFRILGVSVAHGRVEILWHYNRMLHFDYTPIDEKGKVLASSTVKRLIDSEWQRRHESCLPLKKAELVVDPMISHVRLVSETNKTASWSLMWGEVVLSWMR